MTRPDIIVSLKFVNEKMFGYNSCFPLFSVLASRTWTQFQVTCLITSKLNKKINTFNKLTWNTIIFRIDLMIHPLSWLKKSFGSRWREEHWKLIIRWYVNNENRVDLYNWNVATNQPRNIQWLHNYLILEYIMSFEWQDVDGVIESRASHIKSVPNYFRHQKTSH